MVVDEAQVLGAVRPRSLPVRDNDLDISVSGKVSHSSTGSRVLKKNFPKGIYKNVSLPYTKTQDDNKVKEDPK
jgi:hypothetical protein